MTNPKSGVMLDTDHPQTDLLITEALIFLGHELEEMDPPRSRKAWELAEEIVQVHGLELEDAIMQIEHGFGRS